MKNVIAISSNRTGTYLADQPSDSNAARGIETTASLQNAKRFTGGQAEIDAWVTQLGGVPGRWIALEVP